MRGTAAPQKFIVTLHTGGSLLVPLRRVGPKRGWSVSVWVGRRAAMVSGHSFWFGRAFYGAKCVEQSMLVDRLLGFVQPT